MLEIKGLNQYYGSSHTLWDIDLSVKQGDCVCILGRNGVGKTTLLKTIMGLLPIRSGQIFFENNDLSLKHPALRARLGIGYVPQGREIFPQLSVEENLKVPLVACKGANVKIPELIFELFPVLKEMLHRKGGNLSGGQQQQLAIGRALVINPKLLILDEPTEGIQPNIIQEIGEIITYLNQKHNLTVLIVEQKLLFARKVAKSFYLMDKGKFVANAPIEKLTEELIQTYLSV